MAYFHTMLKHARKGWVDNSTMLLSRTMVSLNEWEDNGIIFQHQKYEDKFYICTSPRFW